MKSTPGPWTFDSFALGSAYAPVSHKKIVGPVNPNGSQNLIAEVHMSHPNHDADGRLIAAAPEMFSLLRGFLEFHPQVTGKLHKANFENWKTDAAKLLQKVESEG